MGISVTKDLTIVLPYAGSEAGEDTVEGIRSQMPEAQILLLCPDSVLPLPGCRRIVVMNPSSSESLRSISTHVRTPYLALVTTAEQVSIDPDGLHRLLATAEESGAGLVYADYYSIAANVSSEHPVIDYLEGSLRDDFDFGPVVLLNSRFFSEALEEMGTSEHFAYAGWYAARLALSRKTTFIRIAEFLTKRRKSETVGERQFDYVNPANRDVQIEMEAAVTSHLKRIGAYLSPSFRNVERDDTHYPVVATIVIPVKDRAQTIGDALSSAAQQAASFPFNIIVVDNHSTDGTSERIEAAVRGDSRIIHLIPSREDLGIGGCWNEAINDSRCGKFAIQLDSDDLYAGPDALSRMVAKLVSGPFAMVVGAYRMTDFTLNEIPPGVISHAEWTPDNGRNNVLRVNGFGAPRGFTTRILRQHPMPNVSYGEDYAVGLAISREYQIGRIFDPIYLCRRWAGNSDANLDVVRANAHDRYKDSLRTSELQARRTLNASRNSATPHVE